MRAVSSSPESRAFVSAALRYVRSGAASDARALFRSPYSGVANDISAAVLTVADPRQEALAAITAERLALPPPARDSVIAFAGALRALRESAPGKSEEQLRDLIAQTFALPAHAGTPGDAPPGRAALDLPDPPAPEPPVPMRAHRMHFSASSLNMYVECKRKWYYRYLCGAVEDKGSSASFYGTAFHAALESLHAEFPRPGAVPAQTLRTKLQGYLNAAFDRFASRFDTKIELELQRRRATRTAARYVDWIVAQSERAPFTVIGCELPAALDLEGFEFIGYIDRLDRDDATGNVSVIDYKTGSIAQSADEYREKVRQFKEFQLPFYYWARSAEGDRVTQLALIPLKDALLEVTPVALEVVPAASQTQRRGNGGAHGIIPMIELERARTRMIEICRELTDGGITHFEVTTDPSACRYCAYVLACHDRPAPAEDRFAR